MGTGVTVGREFLPQYLVAPSAPRYILDAANLINERGDSLTSAMGRRIKRFKRLAFGMMALWLAAVITACTSNLILGIVLGVGVALIVNLATIAITADTTAAELITSRLLGVSVAPQDDLEKGIHKGWVVELPQELDPLYACYWHGVRAKAKSKAERSRLDQEFFGDVRAYGNLRSLHDREAARTKLKGKYPQPASA